MAANFETSAATGQQMNWWVSVRTDAESAAFALVEHKEHTNMKRKNTICLWFDKTRMRRRACTPPLFRIVK